MTIQSIIETAEAYGIKFQSRVNNRLHFTNGTIIYLEDATDNIGYPAFLEKAPHGLNAELQTRIMQLRRDL